MNGYAGNDDLNSFAVSGLSAENDTRQVNTVLYCMGESTEHTLTSTNISHEDWGRYATVIAKFDAIFQVWKKVIIEFTHSSISVTKRRVSQLADNSVYGELKDNLIHDHNLSGFATKQCLQLDPDFTLEKAKIIV